MLGRAMSAEWLKLKRKWILALAVIGPLGVVLLQAVNYGLRYDYLMKRHADDPWGGLLQGTTGLMLPALFIGLALVASLSAGVEHAAGGWKQLLALPLTRMQVFAAKTIVLLLLLLLSCTLLLAFTLAFGFALGFGLEGLPWLDLLRQSYAPYAAAMPFVALQIGLSLAMSNQAAPMTIGVLGMVVSMFGVLLPDWVPYNWPWLALESATALRAAAAGLTGGLLLLAAGCIHFTRKDVS
ncbi:ABC transporter permease subunit [Paenibacillus albicereus]|uniref:ABC transporter permease subunit n=1 Tax=Paenibacillus albicereus TaxID=2726185 RepID=A0A6H2GST9_9BACL|nr:ABC transporter permease [Paenibacillus albicereus]QJC50493.1 ABC transporter permease subunit [Paenibacillus albicereus]